MSSSGQPQPRLRPTRLTTLVLIVLVTSVVTWRLAAAFYSDLPPLPWFPSVTVLVLAVGEFFAALNTRARITRKPGTQPVEPLVVARLVALAKASSILGALYMGAQLGLVVRISQSEQFSSQVRADFWVTIIGIFAGILLILAALLLEWSGRIPKPSDDDPNGISGGDFPNDTDDGDS